MRAGSLSARVAAGDLRDRFVDLLEHSRGICTLERQHVLDQHAQGRLDPAAVGGDQVAQPPRECLGHHPCGPKHPPVSAFVAGKLAHAGRDFAGSGYR